MYDTDFYNATGLRYGAVLMQYLPGMDDMRSP